MTAGTSWSWEKWSTEHPVRVAFTGTMAEVVNTKLAGVGLLPSVARKKDLDFLAANHRRLLGAMERDKSHARIAEVMDFSSGSRYPKFRDECLKIMGIGPEAVRAEWSSRGYLVTQFLAMTAGLWKIPSWAMLYSAVQTASHRAFRACQGQGEIETTAELTSQLRSVLGEKFVETLKRENIHLPPGAFLDFGTASMQGWKDRLGSDFALVVGTTVNDIPMYRVVVFQAKWEGSRGSANVSQGDGRQLRDLLATGMGYYVFYPRAVDKKAFVATVRSAESVNSDVHGPSGKPKYDVDVCCARDGGDPAWDFATFVTVAMTSPEDDIGKVFPDADTVAEALSTDRKEPLTARVVFADLTSCLNVRLLAEKLRERGYEEEQQIFETLSSLDDPPEVAEEMSPRDREPWSDPWS
ncbi:hypothetical protein [Azospirillum argentinense]|uniref:Restriction endonuclease n=1 Tax=Azospirillum brasilense TaxID=192 RepID=A0A4D8PZN5_AZOBR|nr:hypothetical protein [Azospirillum argentinense]QCO02858.1 hypothetical protein D3867_13065 [Azospirillum argentinense]